MRRRFPQRAARTIDTHGREARRPQKRAHCRAFGKNGLALKCGDDKDAIAGICNDLRRFMASLDQVSIAILLGAVLVMAGILSSLLALRFGAPLLLVFL
jgi:cell division protein ZapA (FtsZ GTPase activity inhibitor)